jgi:triacylglycerol lipase
MPSIRFAVIACWCVWLLGCASSPQSGDAVILIHGLGRTAASMAILGNRLENAGYRVVRFGYPSTSEPIDTLVAELQTEVERCCRVETETVHFVTHSMGGVLVRAYLAGQPRAHRGRVVMLSPPSQGSEIVDTFASTPLLRSLLGPAGSQLGTGASGIAQRLPPIRFNLGIMTGDRSLNPLSSWLIPGPDDGKVGVDRARLDGTADFLVLPATHTFIMNRRDVADEAIHFLQEGRFRPRDP